MAAKKVLKTKYIDGFVLPLQKRNLDSYLKMARKAAKIWKEFGAIEYNEYIGNDLNVNFGISFPKLSKIKKGETVVFSWIGYKSKAHRDEVNKKVMTDPRLAKMMTDKIPFDSKRMAYGGFDLIVGY